MDNKFQYGDSWTNYVSIYLGISKILRDIYEYMTLETDILILSEEITDPKSNFLVQKYLHDFIEEHLCYNIKGAINSISETDYTNCDYTLIKFAINIEKILKQLLSVYETIYL